MRIRRTEVQEDKKEKRRVQFHLLGNLFPGIPRRTNAIHGRLEDVVLDGFTYDISYSYFSYKENGQPGKLGMITECLPPLIRSIRCGPLGFPIREGNGYSIANSGKKATNGREVGEEEKNSIPEKKESVERALARMVGTGLTYETTRKEASYQH
ncbi:hypothetical protein BC332_01018 [Capsicum chinense]|nr:hypothetical protein BC332_01018 [Capsicum chinense]